LPDSNREKRGKKRSKSAPKRGENGEKAREKRAVKETGYPGIPTARRAENLEIVFSFQFSEKQITRL